LLTFDVESDVILLPPRRCLNHYCVRLLLLAWIWMFHLRKHWLIRLIMQWWDAPHVNFSFVYCCTVTLVRFFFELFLKIVLSYAYDGMWLVGQLQTSNIYLVPS